MFDSTQETIAAVVLGSFLALALALALASELYYGRCCGRCRQYETL